MPLLSEWVAILHYQTFALFKYLIHRETLSIVANDNVMRQIDKNPSSKERKFCIINIFT